MLHRKGLFKKGLFNLAVNELDRVKDTMQTNIPINKKEGNVKQAELEQKTLTSVNAAIKKLG